MNIFYLHKDPVIAAKVQYNKHVVKMILESAQMLCTAHHHYDENTDVPYKKAHYNHPSTKWTRQSIHHVDWLLNHGFEICSEFKKRYGKTHATENVLEWVRVNKHLLDGKIPTTEFIPPPQCMPEEYKLPDTIEAYKKFYIEDKIGVKGLSWKKLNNKPSWIP